MFAAQGMVDLRLLVLARRGLRRLRAAAFEFRREAHDHGREAPLQRLLGSRIVDVGIDAQPHRAVDLATRIAHRDGDRDSRALARAVLNLMGAGKIAREAFLDQLMILGQQEILAQQQRVRREIVERHAAHFRRQGTDHLGKRIQRFARSGLGGICQLGEHERKHHDGNLRSMVGAGRVRRNVFSRRREGRETG